MVKRGGGGQHVINVGEQMKKTTTLSFLRSMNLNVRREGWTLQTKFKIRTAADATVFKEFELSRLTPLRFG